MAILFIFTTSVVLLSIIISLISKVCCSFILSEILPSYMIPLIPLNPYLLVDSLSPAVESRRRACWFLSTDWLTEFREKWDKLIAPPYIMKSSLNTLYVDSVYRGYLFIISNECIVTWTPKKADTRKKSKNI